MAFDQAILVSFVIPVRRDPRASSGVKKILDFSRMLGVNAEIIVCGELLSGQSVAPAKFIPVMPALKGRCVQTGVMVCSGSRVIVCDADVPVQHNDLEFLLKSLEKHDVVFGHRFLHGSFFTIKPPFIRRAASKMFRSLVGYLFNVANPDTQCGIKAYRHHVAQGIFCSLHTQGFSYEVEVFLKARSIGTRIEYVPVRWAYSTSTVNLWVAVPTMLTELWNIRSMSGITETILPS